MWFKYIWIPIVILYFVCLIWYTCLAVRQTHIQLKKRYLKDLEDSCSLFDAINQTIETNEPLSAIWVVSIAVVLIAGLVSFIVYFNLAGGNTIG